jgi:hypothetical protein
MSKRWLTPMLAAIFLCAAVTVIAAQSPNVSGDWEVTITSPQGANTSTLSFKIEGEKLSGVIKNQRGELPIQGMVKGKEIKITFTIKFQDADLPITLTGEVEGEAMKGKADFGGFAEGDWMAKRGGTMPAQTASGAAPADKPASTDKVDISGAWVFEVETAAGSGSPSFTFKQEGENLTGQYKGAFGEGPLTGTVKGKEVKFSVKVNAQGQEMTVTYAGTIENGVIKGTVQLGELGSGTFTGKRQ